MTNEERRNALNAARKYAFRHACAAEEFDFETDLTQFTKHCRLAEIWANVAQAMKDGDPVHDAPDGQPEKVSPVLKTEYGVITR
jgi:hypothetical protein